MSEKVEAERQNAIAGIKRREAESAEERRLAAIAAEKRRAQEAEVKLAEANSRAA